MEYTREKLIELCERAASIPVDKWSDRDAPSATVQLGQCWILLKTGCEFFIRGGVKSEHNSCVTNEHTIWVDIFYPSFDSFEYGNSRYDQDSSFYIPTEKRLDERGESHWY